MCARVGPTLHHENPPVERIVEHVVNRGVRQAEARRGRAPRLLLQLPRVTADRDEVVQAVVARRGQLEELANVWRRRLVNRDGRPVARQTNVLVADWRVPTPLASRLQERS